MSFVYEIHFDDASALFAQSDVSRNQHEVWGTASMYFVWHYLHIGYVRTAVFQNKMVLFRPDRTVAYNHQHPNLMFLWPCIMNWPY